MPPHSTSFSQPNPQPIRAMEDEVGVETMSTLKDVEVSDIEQAPYHAADLTVIKTSSNDRVKTSRYSTGILTCAGWTPLDNSAWTVIRSETSEAVEAEVNELIECHEADRSRYVTATKLCLDNSTDTPHTGHENANPDHVSGKYLDYASYFRYAGWTGCASLEQGNKTNIETTASPTPPEQRNVPSDVLASTTNTERATGSALWMNQTIPTHCTDRRSSAEVLERTEGRTVLETKPAKQTRVFFHPEEDAWLLLFHSKIKEAAETGRHIKLPGTRPILAAFNEFFEGRVMKNERGEDMPPRRAREENSMKGKIRKSHSKIWQLRDVTRKLLESKRGGIEFVPDINEEELRQYIIEESRHDRNDRTVGMESLQDL